MEPALHGVGVDLPVAEWGVMERHEAEAIYDAGRERCVDFILELQTCYERLEARVEKLEEQLRQSSRNSASALAGSSRGAAAAPAKAIRPARGRPAGPSRPSSAAAADRPSRDRKSVV